MKSPGFFISISWILTKRSWQVCIYWTSEFSPYFLSQFWSETPEIYTYFIVENSYLRFPTTMQNFSRKKHRISHLNRFSYERRKKSAALKIAHRLKLVFSYCYRKMENDIRSICILINMPPSFLHFREKNRFQKWF